MRFLVLLVFLISIGACASQSRSDAPASLEPFSASMRSCKASMDEQVLPIATEMASIESVAEMRHWIDVDHSHYFSSVIRKVRSRTVAMGRIDPIVAADQIRVIQALSDELERDANFPACGADVRDYVMESLFVGLGGERALVMNELRKDGVTAVAEQKWVLLTALLAGSLKGAD